MDFTSFMAGLRNVLISSAGIKIDGSGAAGTLIAALSSIDQSRNLVVDVPLVSRSERSGEGGNHPFRLDENFQSVAYLTNITQRPTRVLMAIFHQGGMFTPELMTVGPQETIAIDLLQLRNSQVKDVRNRMLPMDLSEGQVFWKPHEGEALIGRVVMLDKAGGIVSNFSCPNCCTYEPTRWVASPDPFQGPVGGSQQMTLYQYETLCGCCEVGPYQVGWVRYIYSDNTSVATVNSSGMVSFVGPGSANIVWGISYYHSDNISAEDCANFIVDTEVPCPICVVQVSIQDGPRILVMGARGNQITLTAIGSPPNGVFVWSTDSSNVTLSNTDSATVTVTAIAASSTQNDVTIFVSYLVCGAEARTGTTLTVQTPTSLSLIETIGQGARDCGTGSAGLERRVR